MGEVIDEEVSVNFMKAPTSLYWRGRRYAITNVGLHHITREGRTMLHIFSVTDGANFFKLQLDTETLAWRLLEIET